MINLSQIYNKSVKFMIKVDSEKCTIARLCTYTYATSYFYATSLLTFEFENLILTFFHFSRLAWLELRKALQAYWLL